MSKQNAASLLVFASMLAACVQLETSEGTHLSNGQSYSPSDAASVSIYVEKPSFKYAIVGVVEARGMGFTNEARDQELAIQALKREAASMGANGVIISDSKQEIADISKNGTSTERRIKGLAIRQE